MSYTKATDFSVKDGLTTGDPLKVVRGSEIDAEFDAIETADAQNVKLTGSQTITGKGIDLATNTLTGTIAQFNTALSDGNFATQAGTETLTNKTISLASNTVTGTAAEFNTAVSDDNFLLESGNNLATFNEGAAPSTPAAGKVALYAKADGTLYSMDDAGTEYAVSAAATDSLSGNVELATTAEVRTGTDTGRVPSVSSMRDGLIVNGTLTATTSGTQVLFGSIPAWVKQINVMFSGVSLSGSDQLIIQIGDSGGLENTGYASGALYVSDDTAANMGTSTSAFQITSGNTAGATTHGVVTLRLMDSATNLWALNGNLINTAGPRMFITAGTKALSAALTQLAIDTDGTNTFDAGSINISYE